MKLVAKTLVLAAMLGGAVNLAHAEGNADAGKTKAAVCGACHGADGNSAVPSFPKLAGQNVRYLEKQLHDIKSGARQVLPMAGIVPGLSDQDIEDLAAYFSSQKVSIGAADPKLVERGQEIFRGGIKDAGVPACASCHGASGLGNAGAGFPQLSGQHAAYVEAQLKAFRAAGREDAEGVRRTNDGEGRMMQVTAGRLSDNDIKALASYINGLH